MKFFLRYCAFIAFFSASIAAAQKKPQTDDIRKFEELGGKVMYLGKTHDLDTWALVGWNGPLKTLIYVTPAGAIIKGTIYNPDGTEFDGDGKKPKSERFFDAVQAGSSIIIGNPDTPAVYIIVTLATPDTAKFWYRLKDGVDAGRMHLRIVPIAKDEDSKRRAAALLGSATPRQRWDEEMNGRAAIPAEIPKDALDKVLMNSVLAADWKLPVFPFAIYRKQNEGSLMTVAGLSQADLLPE